MPSAIHLTPKQRNPMKPVRQYQSPLLFRKGNKPNRILRIKPATKLTFVFRPVRFGLKPKILNVTPPS
jgi:hypothetical protein